MKKPLYMLNYFPVQIFCATLDSDITKTLTKVKFFLYHYKEMVDNIGIKELQM